jgi:Right handed beta helix region
MKRFLIIAFLLLAGQAWGLTHTVCSSGCDYTTVQSALVANDYSPGDTVTVSGTIVETAGLDFANPVNNDWGVTIQGDGTWVCDLNEQYVTLDGVSNATIKNVSFINASWGISANANADNITLENVSLVTTARGIYASAGCEGWILTNVTVDVGARQAIYCDSCVSMTINGATITMGDTLANSGYGVGFLSASGTNVVSSVSIAATTALAAVRVYDSTGTYNFTGLTISEAGGGYGVLLDSGAAVVSLTTGSIAAGLDGIKLWGSTGNITIDGFTISPAQDGGIYVLSSATGTKIIRNVTISGGTGNGIAVNASANVTVQDFNISHLTSAGGGVFITDSDTLSFTDGEISYSDGDGFYGHSGLNGLTINRVRSHHNGRSADDTTGDGFTFHDADANILIQHCISDHNLNSGFAFIGTSSGIVYNSVAASNGGATSFGGNPSSRGGIYISLTGTTGGGWTFKNYLGEANYPYELLLNDNAYADVTMSNNCYSHIGNGVTEAQFANIDTADKTWAQWVALEKETSGKYATKSINANYTLPAGHEAIDAGTPVFTAAQWSAGGDYAGNHYVYKNAPDIGAYEYQNKLDGPPIMGGAGMFIFEDSWLCSQSNTNCYVAP